MSNQGGKIKLSSIQQMSPNAIVIPNKEMGLWVAQEEEL